GARFAVCGTRGGAQAPPRCRPRTSCRRWRQARRTRTTMKTTIMAPRRDAAEIRVGCQETSAPRGERSRGYGWPDGIYELTACGSIGYKSDVPAHLFIVSRDQLDLYRYLSREFSSEADVRVILDRRYGERRGSAELRAARAERRRAERRARNEVRTQITTLGYALVRLS